MVIGLTAAGAAIVGWGIIILIAIGFGAGTRSIMINKGRSGGWGFAIGFFTGLLGLIICLCLSKTPRKQAEEIATMRSYLREFD